MSVSAVFSGSNSWLIDLFNQRRNAAAQPDPTTSLPGASTPQTSQPVGGTIVDPVAGSQGAAGADFFQSAMKVDLSIVQGGGTGGPSQASAANATDDTSANSFLDNLKSLLASTLSGDTSGAETAANALQTEIQGVTGGTPGTTSGAGNGSSQNPFVNDLETLISAAQSGDTAGAQQAAGAVAKDLQGAIGGHHHHHHHAGVRGSESTPSTTGTTATSENAPATAAGAGGASGPLAAAQQAYQLLMDFASSNTTQ
jgi:hypothetical protein